MKHIFIYLSLLIAVALTSCQKEDDLSNEIDFSNIYAIADSDDPVQHLRYQIFTDYGVSVYFNDTIGRYYVRDDVYGNPYYRYETIDPDWAFYTSDGDDMSSSDNTYRYYYVEGEDRQITCLERVKAFLDSMVEEMYPTIIMLADSVELLNSAGERVRSYGTISRSDDALVISNTYFTNFRCLLLTTFADYADDIMEDRYIALERILVTIKIANYTDKLEEFHSVSDPTADYGIEVINDYPTEPPYYADQFDAYYVAYGRPQCFFTSDYGEYVQERYAVRNIQLTEEQLADFIESSRIAYAAVVGPHGFVCPSSVSGTASLPANNEAGRTTDLSYYTELALQYTLEEVTHYWGNYPKVMQKYNIIRDIIVNDMGVDLE